MKLLIATGNAGKAEELRRILEHLNIEVVLPKDLGISADVEEAGSTFAENAYIKAKALFEATGIPTLADDSGLCIDALGGAPGVLTARYGGEIPYEQKFEMLLKQLENVEKENRTAYFECCICCILDAQTMLETSGRCHGWIGFAPHGAGGFGYDPLFMVGDRSFAELDSAEKDEISHRGKALREMVQLLGGKLKGEII